MTSEEIRELQRKMINSNGNGVVENLSYKDAPILVGFEIAYQLAVMNEFLEAKGLIQFVMKEDKKENVNTTNSNIR